VDSIIVIPEREFCNIIVQVGNSRLGWRTRNLSPDYRWIPGSLVLRAPGM